MVHGTSQTLRVHWQGSIFKNIINVSLPSCICKMNRSVTVARLRNANFMSEYIENALSGQSQIIFASITCSWSYEHLLWWYGIKLKLGYYTTLHLIIWLVSQCTWPYSGSRKYYCASWWVFKCTAICIELLWVFTKVVQECVEYIVLHLKYPPAAFFSRRAWTMPKCNAKKFWQGSQHTSFWD